MDTHSRRGNGAEREDGTEYLGSNAALEGVCPPINTGKPEIQTTIGLVGVECQNETLKYITNQREHTHADTAVV